MCCGVGRRLGSSSAQIECSNESSKQQIGASPARRATGLAETARAGRWVSREFVLTENTRYFHYLKQGDLQAKFPRFNMCITAVLLYQYRHCRRPPWQKRNICDYHHSTRALTQTLVGMPCSDQCLDAVACEGSRIIRPTWLLYMERP